MIFPRKDFEKSSCKDADIEKSLLVDMFDKIENERWNLHSLILVKNGTKVFEAYAKGHGPETAEEVYSISKTFVSLAIGICQDLGLLKITDPILPYFRPEFSGKALPGYEKIAIEHLLMMAVGQETDGIDRVLDGADPYETFFQIPLLHEPGTFFFYNNLATYLLSRLVLRVSGMKTNDFLDRHLYSRIDMPKPLWREAFGNTIGPYGLQLGVIDLARVGLLMLNEGVWRNEQLISADYLRKMGSFHVSTPETANEVDRHGYGYQVWINGFGDFRAAGLYKQYVVICREFNVVFATQAFETKEVLDLFTGFVLPALRKGWSSDNFTLRNYLQRFTDHSGIQLEAEKRFRRDNPDHIIEFPFGS
jgi:CubicO group peptidase (beta-lactamase class C family)